MDGTILVTGATGKLGRVLMTELERQGLPARGMSRSAPGMARADLLTGEGLPAALDGAALVIHAATDGRRDVRAAERLLGALRPEQHLLYVSIVGVDRVPLPYYRQKLAVEHLVRARGGSIFRATQFHDLVFTLAHAAARLPVVLYPAFDLQPVDTRDVARRLGSLAASLGPGTAPVEEDFGGPEVRPVRDLFRSFLQVYGKRRPLAPLRLPGKTFRGYRAGGHLAPDHALGAVTWEDYLQHRAAA
ncbi:SDR family oxidoreductase [Dactylosporangium sp. CS-033363]|uniref:SDR family oxidoreductase n=1 Tax=Dactylosporangium sp. CS-033363 TaxID=3239935 RepID=UPI003D8DD76E